MTLIVTVVVNIIMNIVQVLVSDVEAAHSLYKDALKQSATDPTTGKVDVNILAAGMSATTRKQVW